MGVSSVTNVQPAAAEGAASASSTKLAKSAREFEAILLQSWLEKMNQSFVGASDSQDAAHDTVSSLGTQAISTALAARGGIGIARMILRQVHPEAKPTAPPKTQAQSNVAVHETNAIRR